MSRQDDVRSLDTVRVNVGLSAVIGISGGQYVNSFVVNMFAVGGTLEIHGASTSSVWGTGYRVQVGTPITLGGPAQFYLTSQGATSIVDIIKTKDYDPYSGT